MSLLARLGGRSNRKVPFALFKDGNPVSLGVDTPFVLNEVFTGAGAAAADSGNSAQCYAINDEMSLAGDIILSSNTALVAGTQINLGTLDEEVRPPWDFSCVGAVYEPDYSAATPGFYLVKANGQLAFLPFVAKSAATGRVFELTNGVKYLLASAVS